MKGSLIIVLCVDCFVMYDVVLLMGFYKKKCIDFSYFNLYNIGWKMQMWYLTQNLVNLLPFSL